VAGGVVNHSRHRQGRIDTPCWESTDLLPERFVSGDTAELFYCGPARQRKRFADLDGRSAHDCCCKEQRAEGQGK